MRILILTAAAAVMAVAGTAAQAQDEVIGAGGLPTTSFRGFCVEGNVGWDRFQSQGVHNNKLGYGGSVSTG